ncbi:SRPBCC family protein [Flavobacterium commune]|uniref:Orotate phosphoribosyltransferase n=1 Tax=Flavobacterium commune TaxID=1306519 RepID=A0A1D9P6H5_9FLAO|nr:orotate phosphoribosyltransferase [Flavobacterium commune]AOZ98103.1 orotate phosphoribosyltransferase [Flavobacterium commune]
MNLESPKVKVEKSAEELFSLLTDMKNFEKLMPENIAKFEVIGGDSFLFGLKGMPEIQLKVTKKTAPNKIIFGAANDKVPFTLITNIDSVSATSSTVKLDFEGSFNPMMAMMVKGPIGKFIETLANNIPKL